jgi:hypothetical protein
MSQKTELKKIRAAQSKVNQKLLELIQEMRDSFNVPEDADEYYDGLRTILNRIPDKYGKSIYCGKGWYPLIISCDEELTSIYPDYKIILILGSRGYLNYYFEHPGNDILYKEMSNVVRYHKTLASITDQFTGEFI